MRRRTVLGWALLSAARAEAQVTRRPIKIGILIGSNRSDDPEGRSRADAAIETLSSLGWIEGRDVLYNVKFGGGRPDTIAAAAREVVAGTPDAILVTTAQAASNLAGLTKTIPIVFAPVTDPVGLGLVDSLAHPGRNLTGFNLLGLEFLPKYPEALRQAAPALARFTVIYDPTAQPDYSVVIARLESENALPRALLEPVAIRNPDEIEQALSRSAARPGSAVILPPSPLMGAERARVARIALSLRLPSISTYEDYAAMGGLIAYGPDMKELAREGARYLDRILRGANAADLPVQNPSRYRFIVNARVAHEIGLEPSPVLLSRADDVID